MYLATFIGITAILLIVFWLRNVRLYRNSFGTYSGRWKSSLVDSYNILHSPPNYRLLEVSPNFFTYTANLILKVIHFSIFATLLYIFDDIMVLKYIFTGFYALLTITTWNMYKHRRTYFKEMDDTFREAFHPILKASVSLPIFQTVIWGILAVFF